MLDPSNDSELARRFRASAVQSKARAPLNSALARIISERPDLYRLLDHAAPEQQLPVLVLATIHFLVLSETEHPLAEWYPNLTHDHRSATDRQLAPTLEGFVEDRALALIELVGSRRVQTNEVARCALLLPPMHTIAAEVGSLAHLDIGCSAGLNLLLPDFSYRYDERPLIGSPASSVEITCETRGTAPFDLDTIDIPDIVARCGIDERPIDITDPIEARWLEACCWPDQADRFRRLRAAIAAAQLSPPEILAGDAVDSLAPAVERLAPRAHPVVTTSWTLNYLEPARRTEFVSEVDRLGAEMDLSWILAESPALAPELPHADDLNDEHLTALTVVSWRNGQRTVQHLAETHPHGYWIHWR